MFTLFFRIAQRLALAGTATFLTIGEHVVLAVHYPDLLRTLQKQSALLLDWAEVKFSINSAYMVWVDMAGVDEKLVFIAMYFATIFCLIALWWLCKRFSHKLSKHLPWRQKNAKPA